MILVRLKGGLGNQLFQYAAALQLQHLYKHEIQFFVDHLNLFETKRSFKLEFLFEPDAKIVFNKPSQWHTIVLKYNLNRIFPFLFSNIVTDKNFHLVAKRKYYILDGYFQDVTKISYGINMISRILEKYKYSKVESLSNINAFEYDFFTSAAVHIRQGDYLNPSNLNIYYILNENYYKEAILKLPKNVEKLYVFSDTDNPKINLDFPYSIINMSKKNLSDVEEFLIMSRFSNIIVANSTFSFWASLIDYENKNIIAPNKWIKNSQQNNLWIQNMVFFGFKLCDFNI